MSKSIEQYLSDAQELIVLPDVYNQLKLLLDDDNATLEDIAKLINLEPTLASTLLKIANSAMFGFPREVDSIDRALMILGLKEVQNLVDAYGVTASFSGVSSDVMDLDRFWEVSVDCALATRFLAQRLKLNNVQGLFLAGLFHNIGQLALVHLAPKKVQYCEQYSSEETPWERQQAVFGFTFSACSAVLLQQWCLPQSISEPIEQYQFAYQQEKSKEASLLFITTRLALVNSHPGMYSKKTFLGQHLLEDLGLSFQDIDDALEYCQQENMEILSILKII